MDLRRKGEHSETAEIHAILDTSHNTFFNPENNSTLYRLSNWDVERVPEHRIRVQSPLCFLRLSQTKQRIDEETAYSMHKALLFETLP